MKYSDKIVIKKVIAEAFLDEAIIGSLIYTQIDNYINRMTFPFNPGIDEKLVKSEIKNKMHFKLDRVKARNYEHKDFNIVKLGGFTLKDGDKISPLVFHMANEPEEKNASYFYLYIYNDRVQIMYYASGFYENDNLLKKNVEEFIQAKHINLVTKTEQGKIVFKNELNTINEIDVTNYGSATAVAASKVEPMLAKEKAQYRTGRPINHPLFGKGIITKVKTVVDATGKPKYDVTANFKGTQKTLRVGAKQS